MSDTYFKIGQKVRLTGPRWTADYKGEGLRTGDVVEVQSNDDGEPWHEKAGSLGTEDGWNGPENRPDYAVEPVADDVTTEAFESNVRSLLERVGDILIEKNRAYGNSALDPIRAFSKADPVEQLKVRIDDKISRIQRGHDFEDEDTVLDLIGYLTLLTIATEENR